MSIHTPSRLANLSRPLHGLIPAPEIPGPRSGRPRARYAASGAADPPARPGSGIGRQAGATDPRSCANLSHSSRPRGRAGGVSTSVPLIARRASPSTGRMVMPHTVLAQNLSGRNRLWPACYLPQRGGSPGLPVSPAKSTALLWSRVWAPGGGEGTPWWVRYGWLRSCARADRLPGHT